MNTLSTLLLCLATSAFTGGVFASDNPALRRIISLDGTWHIAESGMDKKPEQFERAIPAPGLLDMAQPPFVEAGPSLTHLDKFS